MGYPHLMSVRLAILLLAAMVAGAGGVLAQQGGAAGVLAQRGVGAGARAQQEEPAASAAATVPAAALAYADELAKQTPENMLEWAKKHAKNLLRDDFTPDELSEESIAKIFPREAAQVREAIRFLVGYQIYRRAVGQQETHASRLRDLERESRELEDQIRMVEAMGAPIGSAAAAQREAALATGLYRMEQLEMRRKLAINVERIEGERADAGLRWLAEAHERVKGIAPDILRKVRAPRR